MFYSPIPEARKMMSILLQIGTILTVAAASSACTDSCFCPSSTTMQCSNRGLYRPPEGYWPKIQSLNLAGNHISVLYKNSFSGFPFIYPLYLTNNELVEIDVESFGISPNLQLLFLENNRIERINPAPSGVRLDGLYRIHLQNNSLTSIHPDTWLPASQLQFLFLNNNPIVVPEGQAVLNHPTLELLHMQYGSTLNLGPRSFERLPMLREAVLLSAGIRTIQGAFVNNTRLTTLALNNNLITEVTAGCFAPGNSIGGLYLDANPLQRLDVAALDSAMASGGTLMIRDTPLACSCGYEDLYWWAQLRGIDLYASCGDTSCTFSKGLKP